MVFFLCYINDDCGVSVSHMSEEHGHETHGHKTTSPDHGQEEEEESKGISYRVVAILIKFTLYTRLLCQ